MEPFISIVATLTQHPRNKVIPGVDFKWSKYWTYNVFRIYELIFGRRYGIRLEQVVVDGKVYSFTLENLLCTYEGLMRSWFKLPAFSIVVVPRLAIAGAPSLDIPYMFAIAFDASANTTGSLTMTHTCTGSNGFLTTGFDWAPNAAPGFSSITYNSVAMTITPESPTSHAANITVYFSYLFNPSTGANTISVTASGGTGGFQMISSSYSGVNQGGTLDSHSSTTNSSATTSITLTSTIVAANAWQMGYERNEAGNATDGTGTTHRGAVQTDHSIFDSNADLAAGSHSLIQNFSSTTNSGLILSVAPAAAASAAVFPLFTLMGVGI